LGDLIESEDGSVDDLLPEDENGKKGDNGNSGKDKDDGAGVDGIGFFIDVPPIEFPPSNIPTDG
jgi:hypothetical protein